MSDLNWSEISFDLECLNIYLQKPTRLESLYALLQNYSTRSWSPARKEEPKNQLNREFQWYHRCKYVLSSNYVLHSWRNLIALKLHTIKDKPTVEKFLLDPISCTGIPILLFLDHSKLITNKGEHKALEELQQCERQLQKHQENIFKKIEGGHWYKGEIENEFEGLKLSLKMLEMLKHLVQSTSIEPMRDAVVLMTLMYIVVLAYSLAQVRNDWLIHFLVLCAFFCLHIGSYFSEKAANYFYRVKEMEKKLTERWPHDVLYLHLASPTCILLSM